jgi:hypothetical protein
MATKPSESQPWPGRWRIVSMSAWEDEYLNEEVEAFIEFEPKEGGSFQFGYVEGQIDWVASRRDGKPGIEFSWEGGDGADGTPMSGRGWAILEADELRGMFFIHQGDDSEFVARRNTRKRAKPRKPRR